MNCITFFAKNKYPFSAIDSVIELFRSIDVAFIFQWSVRVVQNVSLEHQGSGFIYQYLKNSPKGPRRKSGDLKRDIDRTTLTAGII